MIYTAQMIDNEFANCINTWLNEGYLLCTQNVGGSYSHEVCHIDFINPKDKDKQYRLWLLRTYSYTDKYLEDNTIKIVFKEYNHNPKSGLSCWPNEGTTIEELSFYELDNKNNVRTYVSSKDELEHYRQIRVERYECVPYTNNNYCEKIVNLDKMKFTTKASILNRIRTVKGFKRADLDSIVKVTSIYVTSRDNKCKHYAKIDYRYKDKTGSLIIK